MGEAYPPEVRELLDRGWTVERVSLYDEEGVDGWRWIDPEGNEYAVMGDWSEPPPLPEHMEPPARRERR